MGRNWSRAERRSKETGQTVRHPDTGLPSPSPPGWESCLDPGPRRPSLTLPREPMPPGRLTSPLARTGLRLGPACLIAPACGNPCGPAPHRPPGRPPWAKTPRPQGCRPLSSRWCQPPRLPHSEHHSSQSSTFKKGNKPHPESISHRCQSSF